MQGTMHPTTQCHVPEDRNSKVYIPQSVYIFVSFQPLYIVDSFVLNSDFIITLRVFISLMILHTERAGSTGDTSGM
jgi:hypothetical protein